MLLNIISLTQPQYDALTPEERSIVHAYNDFVKESDRWLAQDRVHKTDMSREMLRGLRNRIVRRVEQNEIEGRQISTVLRRITPYT